MVLSFDLLASLQQLFGWFESLLVFLGSLDQHLTALAQGAPWLFIIVVAAIIFVETGLVVMPFLPGDSLLFVAGAITALAGLNVAMLIVFLIAAAVLGDSVNYTIGRRIGLKLFANPDSRVFKRVYLERTQFFYDKYGVFSIVMGRFVPIVRTFVPFLAGVASMPYRIFFICNVIGGVLWIALLTYAGYWFGNIDWVKRNLELIVIAIVFISVLPMVIKFWLEWRRARR